MKRYKVEYRIGNESQYAGFEPHSEIYESLYVEAYSEQRAILVAINYLCDNMTSNTASGQDYIAVYDADDSLEIREYYYDFTATEVK